MQLFLCFLQSFLLSFDAHGIASEMGAAAHALLGRAVEMHAQHVSLRVSRHMGGADWLRCGAPSRVSPLVDFVLREMRHLQRLASQLSQPDGGLGHLGGAEAAGRALVPQGPFPAAASATSAILGPKTSEGASSAIQKDLQRMFARRIGYDASAALGGAREGRVPVGPMVSATLKLVLKTLVEETRQCTFGPGGFQQVQLDVAMLRWAVPCAVDDDADALALLDEVLISCAERSVNAPPLEHAAIEAMCEAERKYLAGAALRA